jgi:hypothetical protein
MDKKLNIFCYSSLYTNDGKKDFLNIIQNIFNEVIVIDNSYDPQMPLSVEDIIFYQKINKLASKNNNFINVISSETIDNSFLLSLSNFSFISFPLAALYGVFSLLGEDNVWNYNNQIKQTYLEKPKYFLKCLNHNMNSSRVIMVDLLEKNNLLQDSTTLYSWNRANVNERDTPEFKYYNGAYHKIDDVADEWSYQYTSPILQRNSIIHLVGETSHLISGFTEKTFKPILYGECFVLYGVKNQNKLLTEFGFRIFDNIIDYEFDHISDEKDGIKKIVSQIYKLKNTPFDKILNKTIDTVLHNSKLAIDIVKNKKYVPNILKTDKGNIKIYSISANLRPICQD